jgi:hypothetical protein
MNPAYVKAREVVIQRVLFQVQQAVSESVYHQIAHHLERDEREHATGIADVIAGSIVHRFRAGLAAIGRYSHEVGFDVPADWYQALRERFAPAWWLRRWPVKTRRLSKSVTMYKAVCPHVGVRRDDTHFAFLAESAAMPLEWDDDQSMRVEPARLRRVVHSAALLDRWPWRGPGWDGD